MPADVYQSIASIANLGPGASVVVAHGIKVAGMDAAPTLVMPSAASPVVVSSVTATQVTYRNDGVAPETVDFLCQFTHSFQKFPQWATNMYWQGLGASLGPLDPDFTRVILPGANKAAEINAAITALATLAAADGIERTVQLVEGIYTLESAIDMQSYIKLCGKGRATILRPTFTGGADDQTNAVIKVDGTISTTRLNTTLAALTAKDSPTFTVNAIGTFALLNGTYFYVEGNNASSNSYGDSDGVNIILKQVLKASTIVGNVITSVPSSTVYHAAGVTAREVTPTLEASVCDLDIDCHLVSPVAVGILVRRSIGTRISGVSGIGFSRAMINLEAARNYDVADIYCRGQSNSIIYQDSCQEGSVRNVYSDPFGTRFHASGVVRGMLLFRNRCTLINAVHLRIERCSSAVQIWGGKDISITDCVVRDVDTDQAQTTQQAAGEILAGQRIGGAITTGSGVLAWAEFDHGLTVVNFGCENVRMPANTTNHCMGYLHDTFGALYSNVNFINKGVSALTSFTAGVVLSDFQGAWHGGMVQGAWFALRTENTTVNVRLSGIALDGAPGVAATSGVGLQMDHLLSGGIKIDGLTFGGFAEIVRWGGSFTDYDADLRAVTVQDGTMPFSRCIPVFNNSGVNFSVYDLAEFDAASPAGTCRVTNPGLGANTIPCIIVSGNPADPGTGFMLGAPAPLSSGTVRCDAAAVNVGDLLVHSGATVRRAMTNNAAAAYQACGRALRPKAAGAEGNVPIGPA